MLYKHFFVCYNPKCKRMFSRKGGFMDQTRRLRKKDATHRTLMHSAKLLFEENGISNVTIEQITEKADVSRSTFFSHFTSVDDLLEQIANEEIKDVTDAAHKDGEFSIQALFERLAIDTYPYPYLMSELIVKSILSDDNSSLGRTFSLIDKEIEGEKYDLLSKGFEPGDVSAILFGAYFGLIFRKFINGESFENPEESNEKIQKFIKYMKNQEENTNE